MSNEFQIIFCPQITGRSGCVLWLLRLFCQLFVGWTDWLMDWLERTAKLISWSGQNQPALLETFWNLACSVRKTLETKQKLERQSVKCGEKTHYALVENRKIKLHRYVDKNTNQALWDNNVNTILYTVQSEKTWALILLC